MALSQIQLEAFQERLAKIPTATLLADRGEAIDDICNCQITIRQGVTYVKSVAMSVRWRLNRNIEQIKTIDGELTRRGVDIEGGPEIKRRYRQSRGQIT